MRLPVLATVEVETSSRDDGANGSGCAWVRGCRPCEGSMCVLSETCTLRTDVASVCHSSNSAVAGVVCTYCDAARCGSASTSSKFGKWGCPVHRPCVLRPQSPASICSKDAVAVVIIRVTQAGADVCGESHARA